MPVESHPNTEIYNWAIPHSLRQCCNYWEINYPALFDTVHEGKWCCEM